MKFLELLVLIAVIFGFSTSIAWAQPAEGYLGWQSEAGPYGTYYSNAYEACRAQKQAFNPNPQSRFIGAFSTSDPNRAGCSWTSFQYLCPEETGYGINGCGTTLPAFSSFYCASGFKAVAGRYCVKSDEAVPERPCSFNSGARKNPSVGHPFLLSTGCKILRDEDYSTADGQLNVGRTYRSQPVGKSSSFQSLPKGLAGNWAFDFSHEIQLANVSGTVATPNVKLAFVASDGTVYDFEMNSGGALVPDAATGIYYAPKNIKVEFVGTLPASLSDLLATSSQWLVTDSDDTVWTFQTFVRPSTSVYSIGRPISRVTKENYRWDFVYAPDGGLQSISDSFGRQMVFTWAKFYVSTIGGSYPEAVSSVALPDGTSLRYTYDPPPAASAPSISQVQRLMKAEHLDATAAIIEATSYIYGDTRFPWHITAVARTDGLTIANYSYDTRGRGVSTALAGNIEQYTVASSETVTEALRSVTGPLGKVENYRFQKFGSGSPDYRITQIEGQATTTTPASTRTTSYGADAFIATEVDDEGRTTSFARDSRGRASTVVEAVATPIERTTTMTYHPTLNLVTQEVLAGLTIDYTYDVQGKLLMRTETDTTTHTAPYSTNGQVRSWTFGWSGVGRLLSVNGPKPEAATKDDTLTFTYSPSGNLLTSTNGLGHITTFAGHDANGRPATIADPNGIITAFTYDSRGRTTTINVKHPSSAANDAIMTIDYDVEDRITGISSPVTDKLFMDYNLAGQLTAIRAASGERIDYTNNTAGGVVSEVTKRTNGTTARAVTRTFDSLNRMLTQTLGPGRTTTWVYDKMGNATQMVSARNEATQLAFDPLNRLVQTIAPDTGTSLVAYSALDDVASFTDPVTVETRYVRNGFGDVIQEVSPDRGTSTYTYNSAGELVTMVDGRGQLTNIVRDILGRVLSKTPVGRPAAEIITYSYDAGGVGSYQKGRLTKVLDGSGTTSFQYDHRGNMLLKRQALGSTVTANLSYVYNKADRVTQITYPSGRIVGYVRDTKGRVTTVRTKALSSITSWTNLATAMQYEAYGPLKQATLGNTLSFTANWGNDGRLASRRLYKTSGGLNVSLLSYAYDNDDNITAIADGVSAANSLTYAYDSVNRLSRIVALVGSSVRTDYLHDTNGNRTTVERRVSATDPDPTQSDSYVRTLGTNRLTSVTTPAGTRNIGYDGRGNTVSETRANGVSVAVAYDAYGRLTGYSRTGEASLVHAYNGLDDRVATTAGGSTRRFVTGPDGRVLGEYGVSATDVKAEFIWTQPDAANDNGLFGGGDGVGGYAPLAVAVGDGGAGATTLNWVHGNHMGVPLIITDASGNPAAPADYAAPGFPGQSRTLADLYYNRYRDYDPTTGRYIQADPIGLAGDVNPYVYAMGNPLRYSDPLGLNSVKDHCVYDDNGKLIFCDKPIKEVYWEQWLPVGKFIKACYSAYESSRKKGFNPFEGKTAKQIEAMLHKKGFEPRGPDPRGGKGGYVDPKTGRSYHIDEKNSFGEPPHVDVNRPRSYSGPLEKRKLPMD